MKNNDNKKIIFAVIISILAIVSIGYFVYEASISLSGKNGEAITEEFGDLICVYVGKGNDYKCETKVFKISDGYKYIRCQDYGNNSDLYRNTSKGIVKTFEEIKQLAKDNGDSYVFDKRGVRYNIDDFNVAD